MLSQGINTVIAQEMTTSANSKVHKSLFAIKTIRMGKPNWMLWDELETLTKRTKRLTLKISVLDVESESYKILREQQTQAFERMAEVLRLLDV